MKIEIYIIAIIVALAAYILIKRLFIKNEIITDVKDVPKEIAKKYTYIIRFRKPQYIGAITDFCRHPKNFRMVSKTRKKLKRTIVVKVYEKLGDCIYGCEAAYS